MIIDQDPALKTGTGDSPPVNVSGERAIILHTQRLSTEDGPGIRTTVFFKGCPLHCDWCHNPESISSRPQVHWLEVHCIGCGICLKTCPYGALENKGGVIVRNRTLCQACGKCVSACPAGAQEMLGKIAGLDELLTELLKDRVYYHKSGGGVTLSGGEPLMQPKFAANLLLKLQENGVSTAVDTSGFCAQASLEIVLPDTDLILYDLKEIDPAKHREFTGQDNRRILDNLLFLRDYLAAHPGAMALWIRTPLIPGATANRETIEGVGKFIHDNLGATVQRWELCAFNNLCRDKYRRLDMEWKYASEPLLTGQELAELENTAKRSGPNPDIISATGAARAENT